jgi:hypothetical protein
MNGLPELGAVTCQVPHDGRGYVKETRTHWGNLSQTHLLTLLRLRCVAGTVKSEHEQR